MITFNSLISEFTIGRLKTSRFGRGHEQDLIYQIREWVKHVDSLNPRLRRESKLEMTFVRKILCDGLGHSLPAERPRCTIIPKDGNGTVPDLKVGDFKCDDAYFQINPDFLIELKGPDCIDFRQKQHGRADKKSAAEQAISDMFDEESTCKFAVITNLIDFEIFSRKFADKRSICFSLRKADSPEAIRILFGLLGPGSVLMDDKSVQLDFKRIDSRLKDLSKEFFNVFKVSRENLINHSAKYLTDEKINPFVTRLLSQVIFIIYGETVGLLPRSSLLNVIEAGSFDWSCYLRYCKAIDDGGKIRNMNIELFGYNGGLFSDFKDYHKPFGREILKAIRSLLSFRFTSTDGQLLPRYEIREVLGRVLESSLESNKQEKLYNFTREGKFAEARRKQANRNERQRKGVFYTDRSITNYMVRQVMEVLERRGVNLSRSQWLDPACGSGAFLLEVFDQLVAYEMKKVGLQKTMLGKAPNFDNLKSTLETQVIGRIKGFDFDPLAVGISQLNLSMMCSRPFEKLPSLSGTVTECDSLFSQLDKKFDVIVANPPYMRWSYIPEKYQERLKKHSWYKALTGSKAEVDYSAFFFVNSYYRLKPGGVLAFIATNKLLSSAQSEEFRKWIAEKFEILELFDFRKPVFQGTQVETCIYIMQKKAEAKLSAKGRQYRDVFSYTRSDSYLHTRLVNHVSPKIFEQGPFYTFPTKTSPALLEVYAWYTENSDKFESLGKLLAGKTGMRVTDIPSGDVLIRKPAESVSSKYQPLYDGTCISPKNSTFKDSKRWIISDSEKLSTWMADIPKGQNGYIVMKEITTRPSLVFRQSCPAITAALNVVYNNTETEIDMRSLAKWLRSPFCEAWIELWFGANRHHSTQRWMKIYVETLPVPKRMNFESILPAWILKEVSLFVDGEFRSGSQSKIVSIKSASREKSISERGVGTKRKKSA